MARNSATLAVQECASKPLSTVCFCSIAAANLDYFQIMCTSDATESKTKAVYFHAITQPDHQMHVRDRGHVPYLYVLVEVSYGSSQRQALHGAVILFVN